MKFNRPTFHAYTPRHRSGYTKVDTVSRCEDCRAPLTKFDKGSRCSYCRAVVHNERLELQHNV